MKKLNSPTLLMALVLGTLLMVSSCKKEGCTDPNATNYDSNADTDDGTCQFDNSDELASTQIGGVTYYILEGEYSRNLSLSGSSKYLLRGGVFINSSYTLSIEAGCELYGDKSDAVADFLVIRQGAKIDAQGTASAPIVMSALQNEKGSWGGVIINGYANINAGETAEGECGSGVYGGSDDTDNSGTMRYVRIEYAGFICASEDELNGLSLNAVGSGTTIEYIQTYQGNDDGFEFFGGTVSAKYLVSTGNADDSFDWTHGWRGNGQFWVVHQDNESGDRGIEADNLEGDHGASPFSNPTLCNLTFVGVDDGDAGNTGMRLRRGTKGKIYNAIVVNFPSNGIRVSDTQTTDNMNGGELIFANSVVFNNGTNWVDCTVFEMDATNSTTDPNLTEYVGSVTTNAFDPTTLGSWFSAANYIGAVEASNDWTAGWTR